MNKCKWKWKFLLLVMILLRVEAIATPDDTLKMYQRGKERFRTYCSSCHHVHKEIIGPMLASIPKKRTEQWLLSFIRNSQAVIVSGDGYANHLFQEYNQNVMPSFRQFTDDQIREILLYIEQESLYPSEDFDYSEEVNTNAPAHVLEGRLLFQQQCESCHAIGKEHPSGGPALGSVTKRRPHEWLIPFIKNSQEVIQSGDAYAVYLFNSFERRVMVPMEFLSESQINSILAYIDFASTSSYVEAGVNGKELPSLKPKHPIPDPVIPNDWKPTPVKVVFFVISFFGAVLHLYLIIRLFLYLQRRTPTSKHHVR